MRKKVLFTSALFLCCFLTAQTRYSINLNVPDKGVKAGHLNLGGNNPSGGSIAFNSFYMELDGKPFIPIMGEMHFSRIPHQTWEEQILKVKAGGVNVIATYVFWNIHEEVEGVFDWSGDKNLRAFLDLCKKHDMMTLVRIGPFCHGEIRNGGFPDWIYGRPFQVRTNDIEYLKCVDRLWTNIAGQLKGSYYKDGGNVIGIQLENELQHTAAKWDFNYPGQPLESTVADYDVENTQIGVAVQEKSIIKADAGENHMRTLKEIAISKGIEVPLYTATGWGMAAILPNEVIPVTAAYPYATWDKHPLPSRFYRFKNIQKSPDYEPVRYVTEDYPSFCAEMGAGIQITYNRRPRIPAEAGEALMLRSLGSGANGIGYYMYHGGTSPQGKFGFFSDQPAEVPKMSYDFQAPIGEFGHTRDCYNALRIIHNFTNDFGNLLAPMGVVLPEGSEKIEIEDDSTLRYAVRKKKDSGFIFITNFQDNSPRKDLANIEFTLNLKNSTLKYPNQGNMTIKKNVSLILPFNLDLNGILLKTATVQPLAKITNGGISHYFFFAPEGLEPEYVFDKTTLKGNRAILKPKLGLNSTVKLKSINGEDVLLTTLTRNQALNACKVRTRTSEKLLITSADVMQYGEVIRLQDIESNISLSVFPQSNINKTECKIIRKEKYYSQLVFANETIIVEPEVSMVGNRRFQVNVPESAFKSVSDLLLIVDYIGDTGAAFIDGKMVTDNFFTGDSWKIGLKRYAGMMESKGMYFYLRPIYKEAPYLRELPKTLELDFSCGNVCKVNSIRIVPEYFTEIKLF